MDAQLIETPHPGQADLDGLAEEWRSAPRRWGHPLHSICSYFAMFPPHVPRVFIEWLTRPGDVVYDPFSGRGTAPLEACRLGRTGLGSDANPLACVLTGAKVDPPTLAEVTVRLDELRSHIPTRRRAAVPPDIQMLYAPGVLRQLTWLRSALDVDDRTDRFIMATVLGMMHANYEPGSPARGFSISMPNTFSMSPAYVRRYIDEHGLVPPKVDVFEMVQLKAARMSIPRSTAARGSAWNADARKPKTLDRPARLIFTSPPYLGVINYGKYNWIRLWMLGHEPRRVDEALTATGSLRRYLEFMDEVLTGMAGVLDPAGYLCLMIGDVRDKSSKETLNLAEKVWTDSAEPAGWRHLGVVNDELPEQHKVSRIWGKGKRGNATKVDRILILAPPGSAHQLPPPNRGLLWTPAGTWADRNSEDH
ncbi:MAG: DNA methyltransferase [Myxococcota bacterium]